MEKNEIDALALVREIRDKQYEETRGKTADELISFFRQEAAKVNAQPAAASADRARPSR